MSFIYKKRIFDIFLSISLIIVLSPLMFFVFIFLVLFANVNPIYFSRRVGLNNTTFSMPKFRTMKRNTPDIATHLLKDPDKYILPLGRTLRKYSIDEIPQLFSILIGAMSFVGPRPALHNQSDLIELRKKNNIHKLKPGLTGWAQINGRDELSIKEKVNFDLEYKENKSIYFDMLIIFRTILKVVKKENIDH